jgi:coproporphyrinogen III oxidase
MQNSGNKCIFTSQAGKNYMLSKEDITESFLALQENICINLEAADGKGKFIQDKWDRSGGGGGLSRIITDGNVIEKGGVNFSAVWGNTPAPVLQSMNLQPSDAANFFATGISIVMHPYNPMVPIIHMNVRYFEMSNGMWWFGGGIDLTPHYIDIDQAKYFHRYLRTLCSKHHDSYYPEFKKWADDYFFIRHRDETRGVGGIFFDYLKEANGLTKESRFAFIMDVGKSFIPLYTFMMNENKNRPFNETNKQWQYLRRGRYVEFNLVWDRGTRFGLDTDGRTESILMSLPPQANWVYNFKTDPGSDEEKTLNHLKKGIDWADE